ncbi:hypothetical protein BCV71DRAFT_276404 [Rhizopus microsporus]|uniref:Uncharacterized protein n=1 Tax=Rhizopus microsporus TaxID=58291 RepID=A0A1X0RQ77_RHIZD|nr:hypothetical protein BCV71DRAFT_276404 [Rhizopus microsporus]
MMIRFGTGFGQVFVIEDTCNNILTWHSHLCQLLRLWHEFGKQLNLSRLLDMKRTRRQSKGKLHQYNATVAFMSLGCSVVSAEERAGNKSIRGDLHALNIHGELCQFIQYIYCIFVYKPKPPKD